MNETYRNVFLTVGAVVTIGLYSVLWRENKVYRLFEHIFVGLAVGWSIVALWSENLQKNWWDRMMGTAPSGDSPGTLGLWLFAALIPLGLMGYFVFSRKHNWVSRIPIGILIGIGSGQTIQLWWDQYGRLIQGSFRPIFPSTWESLTVPSRIGVPPEEAARIAAQTYPTQALNNLIFILTLLIVMSYFLFSFELKSKFFQATNRTGRWLMMVAFGAIFGSTVMARFALVIDRLSYVFIEWLQEGVWRSLTGG